MDVLDKGAEKPIRQLVDVAIKEGIDSLSRDLKIMHGDAIIRAGAFGSSQHHVVVLERYRQELTSQARNAWSHTEGALSGHDANSHDLKALLFELITHIRDSLRNSLNSLPQFDKNSPFGMSMIDTEASFNETFWRVVSEINAKIDLYVTRRHQAKNNQVLGARVHVEHMLGNLQTGNGSSASMTVTLASAPAKNPNVNTFTIRSLWAKLAGWVSTARKVLTWIGV